MQYINKIEIMGRVGAIRTQEIQGRKVANFSVMTELIQNLQNSHCFTEATWHQVVAWENVSVDPQIFNMSKGDCVHVIGRIRHNKYTTVDGNDCIFQEIIATEVKFIKSDEPCLK